MFLRVTDGRKYCYYSFYAWGCTATMTAIALFAHFTMDTTEAKELKPATCVKPNTVGKVPLL